MRRAMVLLPLTLACGCQSTPRSEPLQAAPVLDAAAQPQFREAFPHVRVDVGRRIVEFDANMSPMLVPDARAPRFYLEVLCCSPDTREHETLVVTRARPSHIHAALLSIGLHPGSPGRIEMGSGSVARHEPGGDRVSVRITFERDGAPVESDPLEWVVNARAEQPGFIASESQIATSAGSPAPGWVFAGSRIVQSPGGEIYDADGTGVVIGLATFGSELIAWSRIISPDSQVDAPEWVVDFSTLPPAGAPVKVRIRAETIAP